MASNSASGNNRAVHHVSRHSASREHNRRSAQGARLRYVAEYKKGIRRIRSGKGFVYVGSNGKTIRREAVLNRIRALVIPPAWEDVWICPNPSGHIQAVGVDARRRKQYRYHPRWQQTRDETKFEHLIEFGKTLASIRKRVRADLRRPGLPREKVLAIVIRLLEITHIRVGNEEYASKNHSFGLTTLRDKHAKVNGSQVHFEFRGKSGVEHVIDFHDRKLAAVIKACQDLPGQELFQYEDAQGNRHRIGSQDVNTYLKSTTGRDFTAKDFRTWAGTVLAALSLRSFGKASSETEAKKKVVAAIKLVAAELGNTAAVCRKCYVHPRVISAYLEGKLVEQTNRRMKKPATGSLKIGKDEEKAVLALLRQS